MTNLILLAILFFGLVVLPEANKAIVKKYKDFKDIKRKVAIAEIAILFILLAWVVSMP